MNTQQPTREQMIEACAGGNKDAAQFLAHFVDRAHWLDDVADGQAMLTPENIAHHEMAWLVTLTQNPFFLEHRERLLAVLLIGLNGWVDSNAMPAGVQRDVVKGLYHEVCYTVGLLTGGWKRLREVTSSLRHYDIEPVEPAAAPGDGGEPSSEALKEAVRQAESSQRELLGVRNALQVENSQLKQQIAAMQEAATVQIRHEQNGSLKV